jgi:hypothetical protein
MAALPLKAFSGKVESGFGSETIQHSQEQPAVANAAAESPVGGFIAAGWRSAMPLSTCRNGADSIAA